VVSSIVSSPWLGAIAKAHGAHFHHALTGFKWIANEAIRLSHEESYRFVMGYEEALGYTVDTLVRDKDGVSAATVVADMAAWCASQDRSLLDERERMWRRYGMYLSGQVAVTLPGADGAARIRAVMEKLHALPPKAVAGLSVTAVTDLETGKRTRAGGPPEPLSYPRTDLVILDLEGAHRLMARPSGTEPKIKLYVDVRVDVGEDEPANDARARGEALLDKLKTAFRSSVGL
jgi:phosphomannomutase